MNGPVHLDTGARALGALPADEAAAFDAHLAGCQACADEYAEFLQTVALLASAAAQTPPPGLRDAVMRAVAVTPQLPPMPAFGAQDAADGSGAIPLGRHRRAVPWYRRPTALIAAAVAALMVAGGIVIATRPGGVNPTEAATQCVQQASDAHVLRPSVGSGGSVTMATSCDAAVVHLAPLPAPPGGKAYQMWVIAGSQARSAGMVSQQQDSSNTMTVIGLASSDTAIGISVEPAGGSKAPTTQPIWVVPLRG